MAAFFFNTSSIDGVGNNDTSSYTIFEIFLPPTVRFWIVLSFEIPSILCSLLLLFYLFFDRTLRKALNNHVIVILLIVGLLSQTADITNLLTFLRLGYVWPQTHLNCYVWWFVDMFVFSAIGMLMAWASIERHILVFHSHWLNSKKKRILIHYLPLTTIILYAFTFYSVCIFFVPCEQTFDYTQTWCLAPCFLRETTLLLFDTLANGILPSVLISVVNILLFIRVIKQKQRLRQQVQWRKYRRMIIQLFSCSALFLVFECPLLCLSLAHISFGVPPEATAQFDEFVYFGSYFLILWMPFVCLGSLPEFWAKIKTGIQVQHAQRRVGPQTLAPIQVTKMN